MKYFKLTGTIDLQLWALPFAIAWSFAPPPRHKYLWIHFLCFQFQFKREIAA